jgi:WD40 repeat protein
MLVSDGSNKLQLVNAADGAVMIAVSLPRDVQQVPSDGLPKSVAAYAPAPVAFSPDGRRILSGGRVVDRDLLERPFAREAAVLSSPDERRKVSTFPGPVGPITAGAFSRDSKRVVSGSMDGMLRLWEADNPLPGKAFKGHSGAVMSVAFSPDGRRILSGGEDDAVRLWDLDSGKLVHEFKDHADPVTSVAFSRDGRRILSAGMDSSWRVWDAESFAPVIMMQGLPDFEWIVEFPDGRYRATDGASRSLVVVDGVKPLPMEPYEKTFRLSTPVPNDTR